jgi:hypothetical protein
MSKDFDLQFGGEIIEKPTVKTTNKGDEKLIKSKDWIPPSDMNSDEKVLRHPIFEKAFSQILKQWKPKSNVAFLSLCTSSRPYSKSTKYQKFIERFGDHVDFVVVSNGGFIPPDYWNSWPFKNYDSPHEPDGSVDELYQEVMYDRLVRFFNTFDYEYVIANFRPNLRNCKPATEGLQLMKETGRITDFAVIPDKELYDKAAEDGWRGKNGCGAIFPDLHLFIITELENKAKSWSNYRSPSNSLF